MTGDQKDVEDSSSRDVLNTETVGSTVQNFVEDFIGQVDAGLSNKGYTPCTESEHSIRIELSATETAEAGGGLKAHIFHLGAKSTDANTQRMTIYAKRVDPVIEEAEKAARLAQSVAEKAKADKETKVAKRKPNFDVV